MTLVELESGLVVNLDLVQAFNASGEVWNGENTPVAICFSQKDIEVIKQGFVTRLHKPLEGTKQ